MSRKRYNVIWSYFGSKSKIARHYPKPKFGTIIEPFSGAAHYSLRHFENDVILYDPSPYVAEVWRFLLKASPMDILRLPNVPSHDHIDNYPGLSDGEKYLIGFSLCRGKAVPRKVGHGQNSWARDRIRIAKDLHKIKHWTFVQGSYTETPDIVATHFIDPPYKTTLEDPERSSDAYPCGKIDYDHLALYCRSRKGLVIVCEGRGADWLPFEPFALTSANTNNRETKRTMEYVWIQEN